MSNMFSPLTSALPFTPRDLGRERVQMRRPEATERIEPLIDVTQCTAVDRVQAVLPFGADCRKPVISQHFQMLRHRRLRDRELVLHDGADRPGRYLAVGEQLQDATAHWITQNVERVHSLNI